MKHPITVVLRSYNDAALLPRTLEALDRQTGVEIDLHVFESASTDNSVEIFEAHGYTRITHLEPGSYRSSKVLNAGVKAAETEVVVFLNSDAILETEDSLFRLADHLLSDAAIGGVFARQTCRPDADFFTRLEYAHTFDNRDNMKDQADWLSLVCSAIRRSVWEQVPFHENLTFAEDAVWTFDVKPLGYRVEYVAEAVAEHSHNYTWPQRYRRAYGDAAALAIAFPDKPSGALGGFVLPLIKRTLRQGWESLKAGAPHRVPQAFFYQYPWMLGNWRGEVDGWRHFHGPAETKPAPSKVGEPDLQPLPK